MPPMRTVFPLMVTSAAASLTTVSVVMIALAASAEPSSVRDSASFGVASRIGSIGSTWPITPVDATTTSSGSKCSALAAASHIICAFCSPSALQVLAFPELQMTACAMPSARLRRVT